MAYKEIFESTVCSASGVRVPKPPNFSVTFADTIFFRFLDTHKDLSKENIEMDRKESTESDCSAGNWEVGSPPSDGGGFSGQETGAGGGGKVPKITNMATNIGRVKNAGFTSTAAAAAAAASTAQGAVSGGISGDGSGGRSGELMMQIKKRGRPIKYEFDQNLRAGYLDSIPDAPPGFALLTLPPHENLSGSKRGCAKRSGSCKRESIGCLGDLLGSKAGRDFTPHVITVYTGEDIAAKILTFAQKSGRGVCILSASGPVSNVALRQPASFGAGLLTFEGCFEILTLRGSYTYRVSDTGGIKNWTGGLTVSLASSDGHMIGGGVAGLLLAASPIQIVVGSFVPNSRKTGQRSHANEPRTSATTTAVTAATQAQPAESNCCRTTAICSSNRDCPNSACTDHTIDRNGFDHKPCPDIDQSAPVEDH